MKRFLLRCKQKGFTLLELLTVVAIIVLLAGLILAGMGYAQQKAASERAKAEIAAMSLALESYKIDNGDYPRVLVTATATNTDGLNPTTVNPSNYVANAKILYQALVGDLDGNGKTDTGARVYFTFKPDSLSSGTALSGTTHVIDPFGYAYGYSTMARARAETGGAGTGGYNPTFDLWSTGGQTVAGGTGKWITNW